MALVKILNEGERLIFSIGGQEVSMALKVKAGRLAVFEIIADRSVAITTVTADKIHVGTPGYKHL
jgi:hypothetical protein